MSAPSLRHTADNKSTPNLPQTPTGPFSYPRYDSPPRARTRHDSRQLSIAGSITSLGGVLETAAQADRGSIAELGNNAISTLLQPPIIRTGLLPHTAPPISHKAPSARDIPPVTLTNIPHIEPSVFRPYIAQAGSLYEVFRRTRDEQQQKSHSGDRRHSRQNSTASEYFPSVSGRVPATPGPISPRTIISSPIVTSPLEQPQLRRRSSGGVTRRAAPAVAPLSTIPNVYFDEDFHLENPRTFDTVSERAEIARPSSSGQNGAVVASGKKALATNAILQEKLSWYMDTVEIHLISSIASASSSFFAALGSLKELHSEAEQSVSKIKSLREDLAKIDQEMALDGMKIVAMRQRRENMQKLSNAITQLQQVVEGIQRCEAQVDGGEVEEALDGLASVTNLMEGRPAISEKDLKAPASGNIMPKPIDLRGLRALDGIASDVSALRKRVGKNFETRFIQTLIGDIRQHVDSAALETTFQRWDKASNRTRHGRTPSVFPAYLHIESSLRSALLAHLKGLARSDSVVPATVAYRELLLREIKNLIRRQLPSSSDDDTESTVSIATQDTARLSQQEKSSILARNLRALDPEDAETMLKKIYANVGEALRRLGTQVKLLLDITSTLSNPPPRSPLKSPRVMSPDGTRSEFFDGPGTPTVRHDEIQQALDLSGLLGQAVDIAQNQIIKILKVRSDQSTRLDLPLFLRYFALNRLFADECEAVSGRGGASLKTVVNAHIKDFVHNFAEAQRKALIDVMDSDSWDANDFSDADSARLTRILDSSTRDIEAWTQDSEIWHDQNKPQPNGHISKATPNGTPASSPLQARSAVIDEQKYILPASGPAALSGIESFSHLLSGIPSLTPDISLQLCDYLKLFNSRSSQLILGAGATKSAGLKNITAKHLTLSSQALSFIIALIPYVREFVRRRPGSGGVMIEFDKVKRLLQEHQTGIHEKLVDIMSGRAAAHVGVMRKIEWDGAKGTAGGGEGEGTVSAYMQALVKETTTLHKVLSKHLPEATVQMILVPVLRSYREQLGRAFGDVRVGTKGGKERMMRDVEFFKARMAKIEGSSGLGDFIVTIVGNKPLESGKEGNAAAAATPAAEGDRKEKTAGEGKEGS